MENIKQPIEMSPNMADRIVTCICVLHNSHRQRSLGEASLLELQTQEDSFSAHLVEPERQVTRSNRSNLRARRVRYAFTISIVIWAE
jgi:hypothetical protein